MEVVAYRDVTVRTLIVQRTAWLGLFLAGLLLCTTVMHKYEVLLQQHVELAVFVPLLIGHAGNSGGQTVSAVIRSLGDGTVTVADAGRISRKEALAGVVQSALLAALPGGPVHVVGVACGDGVKERRLLGALAGTGLGDLSATPMDVSEPLVTAAAEAMASVPGVNAVDALAVDITAVSDLAPLLAPRRPGCRVVTLFGVISTLGPDVLGGALSLMDRGDLLRVSANLLPDHPGARDAVMTQYDNAPTREWLTTVLEEIGIHDAGPIAFRWDDAPAGPAIVGEVVPHHLCVAEVDGMTVGLAPDAPIRVLESFRHSEVALRTVLMDEALEVLVIAVSPSGEEGVALARRA